MGIPDYVDLAWHGDDGRRPGPRRSLQLARDRRGRRGAGRRGRPRPGVHADRRSAARHDLDGPVPLRSVQGRAARAHDRRGPRAAGLPGLRPVGLARPAVRLGLRRALPVRGPPLGARGVPAGSARPAEPDPVDRARARGPAADPPGRDRRSCRRCCWSMSMSGARPSSRPGWAARPGPATIRARSTPGCCCGWPTPNASRAWSPP